MYLDAMEASDVCVGYGELGRLGSLGYEGQRVVVKGELYPHALSAHGPSRIVYRLGGRHRQFQCRVAINDDVLEYRAHADFLVRIDGKQVVREPYVVAGEVPREIRIDVTGAQVLELIVETTTWERCHAVWLSPTLNDTSVDRAHFRLVDPLGRVEIDVPPVGPSVRRCIATVVSPGFEMWVDNMLGSVRANGDCADAQLVLFAVDGSDACRRVAEKHGAILVQCRRRAHVDVTVKALLYSVSRVVPAEQYVCLDADMMVLGSLVPLFEAVEAAPSGSVLVVREANHLGRYKLADALIHTYFGAPGDMRRVLGVVNGEGEYPLVINDGMFAGTAAALSAVDGVIRRMPEAIAWMEERRHVCWWRNQFLFNLALARLHCGVEVDGCFNVQLHTSNVDVVGEGRAARVSWRGKPVRVLHFCGIGKQKYPQFHRAYA